MKTEVDENNNKFLEIILLSVVAGIGGGVAYLQKYIETKVFLIRFFMAQVVVSGFCGGLVGFIATRSFPDLSYPIAGVAGIFGIQLLYLLVNIWFKFFGKQAGIEIDELKPPRYKKPNKD